MFNRFTADDLAKNYQNEVAKLQSLKKKAHDLSESKKSEVNPEDFLVTPENDENVYHKDLDDKIQSVSNYAADKPCPKCHKVHSLTEDCVDSKQENQAKDKDETKKETEEEDMSYLVDKKAEYVLLQLGKIAAGLRQKNKNFAADMVEATAIEIKDQTLAKAAQKLQVISVLKKMANKSYQKQDRLTGDVISVTIENIKKAT